MPEPGDSRKGRQRFLRQAIDETIRSLGGPISKTISWHMNNRGILSDSENLDVKLFYVNLKELLGPGAEMIMEETWERLVRRLNDGRQYDEGSVVERISNLMNAGAEA